MGFICCRLIVIYEQVKTHTSQRYSPTGHGQSDTHMNYTTWRRFVCVARSPKKCERLLFISFIVCFHMGQLGFCLSASSCGFHMGQLGFCLSASSCASIWVNSASVYQLHRVLPYGSTRLPLDGFSWNFTLGGILLKSFGQIQLRSTRDKSNSHLA